MNKIESFQIDHRFLQPQVRLAGKKTYKGIVVTKFDIRLRKPNTKPVPTGIMHTLEHLLATFLRSDPKVDKMLIDISPMGCRTGFYMSMLGDRGVREIIPLLRKSFEEIITFEGGIPGATEKECGNYKDHNLEGAKREAMAYVQYLK
jgi:S-ribosylhomocysteine lyase